MYASDVALLITDLIIRGYLSFKTPETRERAVCFSLTHLNSGLVQFGGPRQFLSAVYVRIMGFCKRRFQFCQLLLRNNWKAVVKADLNYPAGNLDAVRKIGCNQNAVIDQRGLFSGESHAFLRYLGERRYRERNTETDNFDYSQ